MTSKALGLIETIGLAAAIEAADAASKSANVTLLGYENAKGGGRITVKLAGDVGAVKAAVSAGSAAALRVGRVASCLVIPRPHDEIESLIHQVDRGKSAQPAEARPELAAMTEAVKPKTDTPRPKPSPKAARTVAPAKSQPKPPAKARLVTPAKRKAVPKPEQPAMPAPPPQLAAPAPPPTPVVPDEPQPAEGDQPEAPAAIE